MNRKHKNKRIASTSHPIIHALLNQLYVFPTKQAALTYVEKLKRDFIFSRQLKDFPPFEGDEFSSAILWVKNFQISNDELAQGYTGNFAEIDYIHEKNVHTLNLKKLDIDLKLHPQKKRDKKSTPDWGHPILRSIKKGRVYNSRLEAQTELNLLCFSYPNICIPAENHMMMMIYEKSSATQSPVQKYILSIQEIAHAKFQILYEKRNPAHHPRMKKKKYNKQSSSNKETIGFFTEKLHKKGRNNLSKKSIKPSDN